jgi:ketosteroid isomerase-like protein
MSWRALIGALVMFGASATARADVFTAVLPINVVDEVVVAELDAANVAFSAAWVAGNIDGLANAYTPDAIVHPPAGGVLTTPEQIRALWAPIANQSRVGHRLEPTLRQRLNSEDEVLEMGRWHTARTNEAGEAPWVSGCYTVIWRKDGVGWRMRYDSWTAPNAHDWACRPR